ncbi:MAG TPA: recombination mediator RecR [Bacteroidia bacterium]|nr:recombination protein RecR [Bacteroidia bacterium]MBP7714443.1 recombination protein RecR [Bacteroidia bacterium]MBP8669045.1 recombination protein RecR [Bacteroidia bacterium]HOZ82198.1 recombination mediator RecR [Bacteroidia bacterium]HQW18108.1 recombination mediator RecR [Bacteroidia bacterium]
MEQYPSRLLEEAVNELSRLPGIGRKGALRLALHLLKQNPADVERLGNAVIQLRSSVVYCHQCHNISENTLCAICANPRRDGSVICVVQDIRDVMAIENTAQFNGMYHVLGGIISPMDGIGPSQLNIDSLVEKTANGNINEIIMALSATMEGDTTVFYISKRLKDIDVKISILARGVAIGGELEFADEVTLGRSLINRVAYENTLVK